MPYIKQEDRSRVDGGNIQTSGELNYAVTRLLLGHTSDFAYDLAVLLQDYIKTNGLSYSKINDCLGALEGAKLEFRRRTDTWSNPELQTLDNIKKEFYDNVAAPYEDTKIKLNGDVY
jgi:hypothetical protein